MSAPPPETVSYFPLPITDHSAFVDRKIIKALKQGGFEPDRSSEYYAVNPTTAAGLTILGNREVTTQLTDENRGVLRAMDARNRRMHERRLFPYEAADAKERGRQVVVGHPAYDEWYDLDVRSYDGEAHGVGLAVVFIHTSILLAAVAAVILYPSIS